MNVDTDYNAGHETGFTKSYITLVGVTQADNSPIAFQTYVKHNDHVVADNMNQWWETCICRLEGITSLFPRSGPYQSTHESQVMTWFFRFFMGDYD